jgi:hypothetical protein
MHLAHTLSFGLPTLIFLPVDVPFIHMYFSLENEQCFVGFGTFYAVKCGFVTKKRERRKTQTFS